MARRLPLLVAALVLATGCPKVQQKSYSFDLAANTGVLRFHNISTDDASKADGDFLQVLNDVVQGSKLETEHPGWVIDGKDFEEVDGRLDGVVRFHFDSPAKAGIYKHDKKSPYIFCVDSGATLLNTDGKRIDDVLTGCVAWERKAKAAAVTFKDEEFDGTETSLLPVYKRWKAGETIEAAANPFESMMQGLQAGDDPEAAGEQLATQLVGGLTSAMGLTGTLTLGAPTTDGGLAPEQISKELGAKEKLGMQTCFQTTAKLGAAQVPAHSVATFTVHPDGALGKTVEVKADGGESVDALAECVQDALSDANFAATGSPTTVSLPLDFSNAQ